jgi:hypothetical protein
MSRLELFVATLLTPQRHLLTRYITGSQFRNFTTPITYLSDPLRHRLDFSA